jgi:hypothetical protein
MKKNQFYILAIGFALAGQSFGSDQCAFDTKFFSKEIYSKNPLVKKIVWSPKNRGAKIITKDDDIISILHWSCNSSGVSAIMLVQPGSSTEESSKNKLLQLAEIVLREPEKHDFMAVAASNFAFDKLIDIPGPVNRPEFFFLVERHTEFQSYQIKYYYN